MAGNMISSKNSRIYAVAALACLFLLVVNGCGPDKPAPPQETGTVTDIDGNVYQTIKIGSQWWMAENLKVSNYNDATPITKVLTDTAAWNNNTSGAYCIYDAPGAPGYLYNWHAITNAKGLAPAGWHVPSDEEWKELEKSLGMTQTEADKTNFRGIDEAGKLRAMGPNYWAPYSNVWSNNESGFAALAGNCRMFDGRWGFPNGYRSTGFWWSSTEHSGGNAGWYRHLDYKKTSIFRYYGLKTYGFSVRCVKD